MQPEMKIRRLDSSAVLPRYMTTGSSGLDLTAIETTTIAPRSRALLRTGISLEIPPGYEGQVRPRSGLAVKTGITVINTPGTIDSDYRGEVKVPLINHGDLPILIQPGERIAQLVICPVIRVRIIESHDLSETKRGTGGFGSTGP